jgi:uncharacterized membrane protein
MFSFIFHENPARSVVKAITFRIIIIISDTIVMYLIVRRIDLALSVMAASNIVSMLLYYIHERTWNRIHWGKRKL